MNGKGSARRRENTAAVRDHWDRIFGPLSPEVPPAVARGRTLLDAAACERCGDTVICARCDSLRAEIDRQQRPVAKPPTLVCSDCYAAAVAGQSGARLGGMCDRTGCYGVLRLGWAK